jgi:hypothetical protein
MLKGYRNVSAPLFNFVCYKYPVRDKKPQYPLTMIMGKEWYAQLKIILARIKEKRLPEVGLAMILG